MMFRQRLWMIPAGQWIGMLAAAYGAWLLATGQASAWWLLAWVAGHLAGGIAISVALHRYFTHGAFRTSKFWHVAMALHSCLVLQGSALGWAAAHMTHHVHSDTDRDPHDTGWGYLWWKTYRDVPMVSWRVKHLVKDPAVAMTHRYGMLVVAAWVYLLWLVGLATGTGASLLLFLYLAPMGTVQVVGAVHQVLSHRGGLHDWPALEFLLPAAGEWMHKRHHERPRAAKMGTAWWHLDYGYWFIRAIETESGTSGSRFFCRNKEKSK